MRGTLSGKARKNEKPAGRAVKVVRVPAVWAAALGEIAAEELNSLTDQVKCAVREYLERRGRLPRPR